MVRSLWLMSITALSLLATPGRAQFGSATFGNRRDKVDSLQDVKHQQNIPNQQEQEKDTQVYEGATSTARSLGKLQQETLNNHASLSIKSVTTGNESRRDLAHHGYDLSSNPLGQALTDPHSSDEKIELLRLDLLQLSEDMNRNNNQDNQKGHNPKIYKWLKKPETQEMLSDPNTWKASIDEGREWLAKSREILCES